MKNYYVILGIDEDVCGYQLHQIARQKLKETYYEDTDDHMFEVAEAYAVLNDVKERKRYEDAIKANEEYSFNDRYPTTYGAEEICEDINALLWKMKIVSSGAVKKGINDMIAGVGSMAVPIIIFLFLSAFSNNVLICYGLFLAGGGMFLRGLWSLYCGLSTSLNFKKEAWERVRIKGQ